MTIMPVPSPFLSSATAETLPAEDPGTDHIPAGSPFLIDEEAFFYAINPPPLPEEDGPEIEQILRALFARAA
jgi:hypothetical protein